MLVPLKRGGKTGLLGGAGVSPNMVTAFGQMNDPPGSRFRVGHAALTMSSIFATMSTEARAPVAYQPYNVPKKY